MPDVRVPDERTDTLLKRLDARIARRMAAPPADVSADRWAYREAAAVLVAFDLVRLHPAPAPDGTVAANPAILLPDLLREPAPTAAPRYALTADVRRQALARLKTRDRIQAALAANPDRGRDDFQQMYEQWLLGTPPPLESQPYDRLTLSAQIAAWLDGIVPGLPTPADVQALLSRQSVYALFEHLATGDFTGRTDELRQLREQVGVLEPETRTDAVLRQLRAWTGQRQRAPLLVVGAGGVGKSALLGKFLRDHANVPDEVRFPFAYLPFDSPTLRIEEPFTIAAEVTRQLELLHPEHAPLFAQFREQTADYRSERQLLDDKIQSATGRRARSGALQAADERLYKTFAALISRICTRGAAAVAPFLLVFDTFEEAQYRGTERLIGFMRLLEALHQHCPSLRIVICTRPPFETILPESLGTLRSLALGELSREESEALLRRIGVADATLARALARQIGGNPLNLRLAARLVQQNAADASGIPGLTTTSWLLFSASAETIRGQLYLRILDHIHNDEVRSLAHPGMVLRRVDPELIQHVLAAPCGVAVPTIDRARALFDELAKEHTLLEPAEQGALRFRPDIRASVLDLLQRDRPAQVRQIHEAAVEFYSRRSDPIARAEELYHRLALDQDPEQLAARWDVVAGPSLAGAIDELPPRAQTWFASQVGLEASPEALERASAADWERFVGRKARDLLRYLHAAPALKLLSERRERLPASPLYALEAKALILEERFDAAIDVLTRGIESIAQAPNRGRLAELLWLQAQTLERTQKPADAARVLERAEDVASTIADRLCRLQILVQQLMLRREAPNAFAGEDSTPLRERLAASMARLSEADMDRERSLVRAALALLGPGYANEFIRGVRFVGVGEMERDARQTLGRSLEALAIDDGAVQSQVRALAADLQSSDVSIDQLIDRLVDAPVVRGVTLPALAAVLEARVNSLSGANLVGIDEYRDRWELELPSEAV